MSVFRVSDWVEYEPTVESRNYIPNRDNEMDGDIDMDAPQISTLREEETPPPQRTPTHSSRFRVKLVAKESGNAPSPSGSDPYWFTIGPLRSQQGGAGHTEDEDDDDGSDEEDQLIDDDDDMKPFPDAKMAALQAHSHPAENSPKRKQPSHKRKPRKTEKRIAEEERKSREQAMQADAANFAPTMTWFEATPSESHPGEEPGHGGGLDAGLGIDVVPSEPILPKASPKKKPSPRKAPPAQRPKAKAPQKIRPALLPLLADEAGMLSDGYSVTAASSPVAAHFDGNSPEPDNMGSFASSAPLVEDINLDSIPLPVFPLPSKPFPVQPPVKISTGFAPIIPLDKSRKKVRHWRTANREIRGIAGGRWFARSWVGEKESEFASAVAASTKDGDKQSVSGAVALPKLSAVSISAPPSGRGRSKASKASLTGSAIPSRAGSAIPDHTAPPRAPTKMRTILSAAPPSEEGNDSDMMAPPGT